MKYRIKMLIKFINYIFIGVYNIIINNNYNNRLQNLQIIFFIYSFFNYFQTNKLSFTSFY